MGPLVTGGRANTAGEIEACHRGDGFGTLDQLGDAVLGVGDDAALRTGIA